jgi:hypothetical protein
MKETTVDERDVDVDVPPSGTGCVECEANGTWWLHLRRCAACGHIGCCDSSLYKHGTAHWKATGHPVETSFEPGESWFYDYRTDQLFDGPRLAAPESHPTNQSTPGPAQRVPGDWEAQLAAGGATV